MIVLDCKAILIDLARNAGRADRLPDAAGEVAYGLAAARPITAFGAKSMRAR